jgi:hypothetical protein
VEPLQEQLASQATSELHPAAEDQRENNSKPVLRYVETHLADHCNLNCKGCGHFSPIASEKFCDLQQLERDLQRLAELLHVARLRLMGGEPLLHPNVAEACSIARKHLPNSTVVIVTNGVLLPKMGAEFWQSCRENRIVLEVTSYPVTLDLERIRRLAEDEQVRLLVQQCVEFFSVFDLSEAQNPEGVMRCRPNYYCPFLYEGALYACALPATAQYFNSKYGTALSQEGAIRIHDDEMTGRRILALLDSPVPLCRYCLLGDSPTFKWAVSRKEQGEWDIGQAGAPLVTEIAPAEQR